MSSPVLLASIEMGYGHLRAAHALEEELATPVLLVDRPPLADEPEQRQWTRARRAYEFVSRASQVPVIGGPFAAALDTLTAIPHLYPYRDLSAPNGAVRYLERTIRRGLGAGLAGRLERTGETLLTTFYAPAIACDLAGCERLFCVVTDTDINRVWAPPDPARTRITYLVPGHRAARRLRSYGVPAARIVHTGFPLPPSLLGGRDLAALRLNLKRRLARLDRQGVFHEENAEELQHFLGAPVTASGAPLVTFAIGGAGAQAGLLKRMLPGLRAALERKELRVALVAGVRRALADQFADWIVEAGLEPLLGDSVRIVHEPAVPDYLRRFNALLAETDVLWSKPSELTFFGALGLPLVMAPPVGRHEAYNLRWARECGVGLKQREPRNLAARIADWLDDGTLAAAAWSGFIRMPKFGTYRIADAVTGGAQQHAPVAQFTNT